MGMRRRPLARAAVVGGVAYHAGKRGAQNAAAEQSQDQQIADLQAQQAQPQYAPPAPAPSAGGADMVTQLENLKKLLDEGVLTQAEFDLQKQKILAGA
jgi:Short C-terminal domain